MTLPVVLREEAEAEFDEAFDYYESKRPGLGVAFASRVHEVFDRIGKNPLLHGVAFADVRKAVVAKFPFSVFYRPEPDRVQVIAVFHSSRDPAIWKGRV